MRLWMQKVALSRVNGMENGYSNQEDLRNITSFYYRWIRNSDLNEKLLKSTTEDFFNSGKMLFFIESHERQVK